MNLFRVILIFFISTSYVKLDEFDINEWMLEIPADNDNLYVGLLINEKTSSIPDEYINFLIKYKKELISYEINLGLVHILFNN